MICTLCCQNPCDGRCPNYQPQEPVEQCYICDEPIYIGDFYISIGEDCYHRTCVESLDVGDWLMLIDSAAELAA